MTITIDKAIEIKLQWHKDNYPPPLADEINADMLSIEALKLVKEIREERRSKNAIYPPLPGEIED